MKTTIGAWSKRYAALITSLFRQTEGISAKVMAVIKQSASQPIVPIFLSYVAAHYPEACLCNAYPVHRPETGQFIVSDIRLGSRGDSYYEYLL
jgi:hypothetical protein